MDEEIKKKVEELAKIMGNYESRFTVLERELYDAVNDYQKALDEEKLKEIRNSVSQIQ